MDYLIHKVDWILAIFEPDTQFNKALIELEKRIGSEFGGLVVITIKRALIQLCEAFGVFVPSTDRTDGDPKNDLESEEVKNVISTKSRTPTEPTP